MGMFKRSIAQLRLRIGSMSRAQQVAAAVLAAAMMAGGAWLIGAPSPDDWQPVVNQTLTGAPLEGATSLLQSRGIVARNRNGKLCVAARNLPAARALLAGDDLSGRGPVSVFEQLSREDDIWRTGEQNAKRWQTAKMSALGRMIGAFPAVSSATVLLEPGQPRSLGKPADPPTAAVNVSLKDGQKMTPKLIEAIADLVAGSVTGMKRDNVRIVDSTGRSHRIDEAGTLTAEDQMEQLRLVESYVAQKVQAALQYAGKVMVAVQLEGTAERARCRSIAISVPRSYLSSLSPSTVSTTDEQFEKSAAPQLAKIRQSVASLLSMENASTVKVDWYYDAAPAAVATATPALAASTLPPYTGTTIAAGIAGILCILLTIRAFRRRSSRAGHVALDAADDRTDDIAAPACSMALLAQMEESQLKEFVQGEHPQTIAIVLAHLSPAKAASVLGDLDSPLQVDVAKRVANLEKIDAEVLRDVERGLSARLSQTPVAQRAHLGGTAAVAQILNHAGYATGRSVLDEISTQEPSLGESIRRRMFEFDDLANISRGRLRAALEKMDLEELAIALCAGSSDVKKKVLDSLPSSAAKRVRDQINAMGPLRLSDVEAAQQAVLDAVHKADQGQYEPVRTTENVEKELLA